MEVKGTAVLPLQMFVRERFGEEGYARWLQALAPEGRAVYSVPVLISRWYPLIERAMEISGCKDVRVDIPASIAHGHKHTDFALTWS